MEILITSWVILALSSAWWATEWGRSGGGFFLLALFLSPLLAAIVLLISGNKHAREASEAAKSEAQRREHERQLESLRAIVGTTKGAGVTAPTAVSSVADELEKLASLLERGFLTDAELADQKRRLLAR